MNSFFFIHFSNTLCSANKTILGLCKTYWYTGFAFTSKFHHDDGCFGHSVYLIVAQVLNKITRDYKAYCNYSKTYDVSTAAGIQGTKSFFIWFTSVLEEINTQVTIAMGYARTTSISMHHKKNWWSFSHVISYAVQ